MLPETQEIQLTQTSPSTLEWHFPLRRTHCGIPLANGNHGVLIWGEDDLHLTVAHAGFWDRRGGNPFLVKATFGKVRELLEANDAKGIKEMFAPPQREGNFPDRPFQIGGARLVLHFERGFKPVKGRILSQEGRVEVELQNPAGELARIYVFVPMDADMTAVELDEAAHGPVQVQCLPAYSWSSEQLANGGIKPPLELTIENGGGFIQELPEDEDLAVAWRRRRGETDLLFITTALGDCEEAAKTAVARARALPETDSAYFWRRYWKDVPKVRLPDARLQHFWDLALFRQAGMTTPGAVAATLQGPWMEEYQLPPWSNDYHFNINVQLIYYPALATNRLEHFLPLWRMIKDWYPTLKKNGETFFDQPGAFMLPHAVDDTCQVVGTFWTGTIDHACTAWVAQMAWLHYRYGLDESILKEYAWPLLNGAFEGYWAMLEEKDGRFSLPVSVSPEYRGSDMDAWGRDASFQIAALHTIAQILPQAAAVLGQPVDARWAEVESKLPPYTLVNGRIGLWENLELEESHRHHSHLAAIYPFCSIDPLSSEHWPTVAKSIAFWSRQGAGNWTGWCLPWASILCSRCELPDAAVSWLHWLLDNFTNEGYSTRHNANFPGVASMDDGSLWNPERKSSPEVMQMDATMGFLTAITELLVQNRHKGIYVLPNLPKRWRELEFDGIRCEGAFLVGATVADSQVQEVRVRSEKGGRLRINPGLGERFAFRDGESTVAVVELETTPGEELVFRRFG